MMTAMPLPIVAIVGRPNVGKSSLFNVLARRRASIVEPTAGVTRDRVSTICDIDDVFFELVDTGGHGIADCDNLDEHVERQIEYAIQQAQLILLVVDAREDVTSLDQGTAELLRRHNSTQRVRLIANKVDNPRLEDNLGEFAALGLGDALPVSAVHGHGRAELRELIRNELAGAETRAPDDPVIKIAVVGKRNVGKSSFINSLVGEERVIVSEIPGTTRDSIDVRLEKDGRTILVIDTAGLRKKARLADSIEFYAYARATRSIRRADVVLFLVDSTEPVSHVDKRLAHLISGEHKACVLVVNKWDLAKGRSSTEEYGEYLGKTLPEIDYMPVAFTSAIQGRNVPSTIDLAAELHKQSNTRVSTGPLNQVLQQALATNAPRAKRGRKQPKFFYATQVSTVPPTIVLFVNAPELVTQNYERYLLNRFREELPFPEIPIRLVFRARRGQTPMT